MQRQHAYCNGHYRSRELCVSDVGIIMPEQLRIAPASASAGTDRELFDSIRYVALETIKESEFQTITQLFVTKDRYIILDQLLDIVLIFDKNGNFINKIASSNKDLPAPYSNPNSPVSIFYITVNEEDQTIKCVYLNHFNYYFTIDGKFLRQEDTKARARETISFKGLEARYYYYRTELTEPQNGLFPNIELVDIKSGNKINSYLHFDTARMNYRQELLGVRRYFYRSGQDRILFTQPYNYTIYELTPSKGLVEKYQIILPLENSLPTDFLSNPTYNNRRRKYVQDNYPNLIYRFTNIYQIKNWLTFNFPPLLYNIQSGDLYSLRRTDLSDWGFPNAGSFPEVLAADGSALISSVDFQAIVKFYSKNAHDNRLGLTNLKGFLKKDFRNPVLQLSYLKD